MRSCYTFNADGLRETLTSDNPTTGYTLQIDPLCKKFGLEKTCQDWHHVECTTFVDTIMIAGETTSLGTDDAIAQQQIFY